MNRCITWLAAAAAACTLLVSAAAQAQSARFGYFPRSSAASVLVVDSRNNTLSGSPIAVAGNAWGVATHPRGHRAYIPVFGGATLSVIDTASGTTIANVAVGTSPYHAAVSPDGTEVWVPNYGGGTISIVSTATNTVVATIPSVASANAIAFHPNGSRAYVSGYTSGVMYVIDTATRTVLATPTIGAGAESVAVHPTGRWVYSTSATGAVGTVSVLDTSNNTVTQSQNIGTPTWGVAVNPNGRFYYVARGARSLEVMDTATNLRVETIDLGGGGRNPTGVNLTANGKLAYVANRGNNTIAVVNLVTHAVQTNIAASNAPHALGNAFALPLSGQGRIAAGQYHTCRVRADASVDCWGRNDFGQATAPAGAFLQVVAGSAHSCGLRSDSTIACWGNNAFGQSTPPAGAFTQISSGARHACGIRADRNLICWGENDVGQAPASTVGPFQDVATGSSHTCAIRQTGAMACFGNNTAGQATPLAGTGHVQVVAGASFTCALGTTGAISCFGDPANGRTSPPAGNFERLFGQSNYACAIDDTGVASCWGADTQGETTVPGGTFADLATGRSHACGQRAIGVIECWGWNLYNQAPKFQIEPLGPLGNGTVGDVFPTATLAMVVSNPGTRYPYAPRAHGFGVSAGVLPPGLTLSVGGVLSGTPTTAGNYAFTIEAEDANGFVASQNYSVSIGTVDTTAPVITATVTGLAGNNGWYRGPVSITWSVVDGESVIGSTTGCGPVTISAETSGTTVTCSASSAGGVAAEDVLVRLDSTPPTLAPVLSNVRPLLNEVLVVTPGASDLGSGVAGETCDPAPTDSVSAAMKRINCSATDVAGNSAVRPVAYRVVYGFQGFFDTVLNPGWWNGATAGQPITFKFRVVDAAGVPQTGLTGVSVGVFSLACPMTVKNTIPVSGASPGLVHTGDGNYEFTWVTPVTPGCARVVLDLGDGDHIKRAQIKFE